MKKAYLKKEAKELPHSKQSKAGKKHEAKETKKHEKKEHKPGDLITKMNAKNAKSKLALMGAI